MAGTSFRFLAAIAVTLAIGLGSSAPAFAVVPPLSQPSWRELSAEQRVILAPLQGEWESLEVYRRKKWIGIAQRYPAMSPEEQSRVKQRMSEWVRLSPEQRKAARTTYKSMKQAPPEQKAAMPQKWQEYSQLPDEEKRRLQAEAAKKASPKPATGRHPVAPKQPAQPTSATVPPAQKAPPASPLTPLSSPDSTLSTPTSRP